LRKLRVAGRLLTLLTLALVAVAATAAPASAADTKKTELDRVLAVAEAQIGDKWSFAATGPNAFDCSGLVTYAFRQTELLERVGGKRRTVAGFYQWFKSRGLADKSGGRPGDLIVWGNNKHIGVYLGNGKAISALVNPYGVKIHPISQSYLHMKIKAFLHVKLER
jgi:cell wall-associated NlpC family hydrolase